MYALRHRNPPRPRGRQDRTRQRHAQDPRAAVHAEGTPAESADVRVADYHQHAVLAEVRPQPAHGNRAWERFTPDGPLALLPIGNDYSVVFTVPPHKADALMAMNDTAFLDALQQQFGRRMQFTATSPRARFPLALRLRRDLVAEREVWIGNAAQTLHPVSGQGFNLGIRDAWELAPRLVSQDGSALGNAADLDRYVAGRRLDRYGSALFTDGIVRSFSNDLPPLKLARGLGPTVLDVLQPVRKFVAGRMIWARAAGLKPGTDVKILGRQPCPVTRPHRLVRALHLAHATRVVEQSGPPLLQRR